MPASPLAVVIVTGGVGAEHEVSLASARAAAAALDPARFAVSTLVIARDGSWCGPDGAPLPGALAQALRHLQEADVAVPLVHGPLGEDGALAALFELAGIAYVGSGVRAGAIGMDKHLTKLVAADLGIAVAPGVLVDTAAGAGRGRERDPDAAPGAGATSGRETAARLTPPLIVKPNSEGSSFGITRVESADELDAALTHASTYGRWVLVEQLIAGREIDLAVMRQRGELRCGAPLEIGATQAGFFDTTAKYEGEPPFTVPAQLPEGVGERLAAAAGAMYEALGCSGVVRADFFLTPSGELVLNEVNTTPGFTEHSQVPLMFAAVGLPYAELLESLIAEALATATDRRPRHIG